MSSQDAYRLGDGAPVAAETARAMWVAVAREVLQESAAAVAQSELARKVQQRSGVYTRVPASQWLPTVLADLGDDELVRRVRADAPPASARTRATTVRRPRAETPTAPKRREAPPPAICPTCFLQLPASGRCDTCG